MEMTGRDKFNKHKKMINWIVQFFAIFSKKFRKKLFDFYKNSNSTVGVLVRYCIIKTLAKTMRR